MLTIDLTRVNAAVEAQYLALGPLDGRYHDIAESLSPYFSEFALMKYRVKVEVEWLIFLLEHLTKSELPPGVEGFCFKNENYEETLRSLYLKFDALEMNRIKVFEKETNHDVKSVELYIDSWLDSFGWGSLKPLVHIGCTSEDINNLAYALMIRDAIEKVWDTEAAKLHQKLDSLANNWAEIPMLAHTHGQPATPTTLGKEIRIMEERLEMTADLVTGVPFKGKFNGATGTYAAISLAYPDHDWVELNRDFVEKSLDLEFNPHTTQIEPHDWIAEILDAVRRYNNILRNIDQDMWTYISMEYLVQAPKKGEVGSSTMPHKVNPIRFENSEANCEISNSLCQVLADQLQNSRMQRDLTDSSLIRNIGLAFGYSVQAIRNCLSGLERIAPGKQKLAADLNAHPEVLAEAIQTILRKHGVPDAYNQLKEMTRGKKIKQSDIDNFISKMISEMKDNRNAYDDLNRLLVMSPEKYIGRAVEIATFDAY